MKIIGIDPGQNGGIALFTISALPYGDIAVNVWNMPVIEKGMDAKGIRDIVATADFVIMEKVSARPGS